MDRALLRITKELAEFQKNSDLAIAVAFKDDDVRNVRAMIMGPHETPYEFGFFEFSIKFPPEYPSKAPQVVALTTNNGQCRFNPNIYSGGKVCLSILGTWRGESGEQWSSAQGLESVLLSIQSLMSANPYANEPGYENSRHDKDGVLQKKYVEKIRHETIRISIIQRLEHYFGLEKEQPARNPGVPDFTKPFLNGSEEQEDLLEALPESPQERYYPEDLDPAAEPFEPFVDLCKRRFLWYYDSYMATIQTGKAENPDKTAFTMMPFEGRSGGPGSNCMPGKFSYTTLEKRILRVKDALCEETRQWAIAGLREKEHDTYVAANLQHQFEQIVAHLKLENSSLDVSLEDGNPFVWLVTYFGKPMTNLDGGLFRLKMCFSPRFPKEQPRVRVETKIFHQAVASDGTLCYIPNPLKMEDVRVHIEAAITALEDESPRYDPRKIVNPEASRLYWGKPEDKKVYSRRLRRAAQQSMEDFPE